MTVRSPFPTGISSIVAVLLLAAPALAPVPLPLPGHALSRPATSTAVGNFSAAVNRMVTLLGVAGGGILALAWARVALSWFSNDVTKKVQAKDRARDALVGSLLFTAALSGLLWGLAHWVVTGT